MHSAWWGPSLGIFIQLLILLATLIIFQIYKPTDINVKRMFFLKLLGCAFTFFMCVVAVLSLREDSSSSFALEEIVWLISYITGTLVIGIILPGMLITSLTSLQNYFEKALMTPLNNLKILLQDVCNNFTRFNEVQPIVPNI